MPESTTEEFRDQPDYSGGSESLNEPGKVLLVPGKGAVVNGYPPTSIEFGKIENINILKKIHAIFSEVPYLQKDAYNDHGKFWYVSEGKVKFELKPLFAEHGVIPHWQPTNARPMPYKDKGGFMWLVDMQWKFIDIETGEYMGGTLPVQAYDLTDKGLSKCLTLAVKNVLESHFLIPRGDDPDGSKHEPDPNEPRRTAKTNGSNRAGDFKQQAEKTATKRSVDDWQPGLGELSAQVNHGTTEQARQIYADLVRALGLKKDSTPSPDDLGLAIAHKLGATDIREVGDVEIISTVQSIAKFGSEKGAGKAISAILEFAKRKPVVPVEPEAAEETPAEAARAEASTPRAARTNGTATNSKPAGPVAPMTFYSRIIARLAKHDREHSASGSPQALNAYIKQLYGTTELDKVEDQGALVSILEAMIGMENQELLALLNEPA